jgi:hypothetical protein
VTCVGGQVRASLVENLGQMAENIKAVDGRIQDLLAKAKNK